MKFYTILKIVCFFCVFIVFGIYFFRQAGSYLTGPEIIVDFPKDGGTLLNSFIFVKGRILNASILKINGEAVLANDGGNFETGLLLARGYNIINLAAKDKFGRTTTKRLEVVLK